MGTKKPKKDEVVTLEGVVNDITPTLIRVDTHNIAVLGDTVNRMRGLCVSLGDTVKITYKNGILLTIDLTVKNPEEVHIDKSEVTAGTTLPESINVVDKIKAETSESSSATNIDMHMQKCRVCGGKMRVVVNIGSGMSLTQCLSCKLIDTDPQMG